MPNEKDKNPNSDAPVKPDPETLHTTDPQKEREGPLSSFMNEVGDEVKDEGKKINPGPEEEDIEKDN
jgi:hypothetical protein